MEIAKIALAYLYFFFVELNDKHLIRLLFNMADKNSTGGVEAK